MNGEWGRGGGASACALRNVERFFCTRLKYDGVVGGGGSGKKSCNSNMVVQ